MDFRFCNDYISRLIKSAIAIPLLKYKKEDQKYVISDGLCNVAKSNSTKSILRVGDWLFSNGDKLKPEDIKLSIQWMINNNNKIKDFLKDLKQIKVKNNEIIFYHNSNIGFLHLLTSNLLSPFKEKNIFCGYFSLSSANNKSIELITNKSNIKVDEKIVFNIIGDNKKDVLLYDNNECDFTNNTTFPIELYKQYKNEVYIDQNYIKFSLSFVNKKLLTKDFDVLREIIFLSIDRNKIAKNFSPLLKPSNDYLLTSENSLDKNISFFNNKPYCLVLGYDDYYPNKQICLYLQKQLRKNNVEIKLIQTDFYTRKDSNIDIQLNLFTPDCLNNEWYYLSTYFGLLLKINNIRLFKKYQKLKKQYLATGNPDRIKEIRLLIDRLFLEIPLFNENSIYLTKYKKFDFNISNFECFLDSKH